MLAESKLPKLLWAEAAATQIYTHNHLPSSCHPDKISKEQWTGRRQSIAYLYPFGCISYAKVSGELVMPKLDSQLIKYVLVEYADNRYQLYDKGTCTVITSCDVIFDKGYRH